MPLWIDFPYKKPPSRTMKESYPTKIFSEKIIIAHECIGYSVVYLGEGSGKEQIPPPSHQWVFCFLSDTIILATQGHILLLNIM